MNKITLGVLFGGVSSEHDISTVSAKGILSAIDKEKYNLVLLGITKEGRWFLFDDDIDLLPEDRWLTSPSLVPAWISPDRSVHGVVTAKGDTIRLDAVFPVLHGKNGEDGTVQGLLQLAGIPFVGCDATASGVCMDKAVTNAVADAVGIAQAKWCAYTRFAYDSDREGCLQAAEEKLGYPIFVKPANAGSSVGITKATDRESLVRGMEVAFAEDKKAVLEACVVGHEVECAVMGNDTPIAAQVGEIVAAADFYDFDAKYNNPQSELHIPADLSPEKLEEVRAAALRAYGAMGCEGLSRVDFFVTYDGEQVLLNEINTIPGSLAFYLWQESGIAFDELLDKMIWLAIKRKREKDALTVTFDTNILSNNALGGSKGGKMGSKR